MGVVVWGADFIPGQVEDAADGVNSFLLDVDNNVKPTLSPGLEEPIKFGVMDSMHGTNGLTKGDADHVTNVSTPKDAVDEWPAPKQIHTFYFVKFRTFEDPKLKSKIEQVDKEIQKTNQGRIQIIEALKTKRSKRSHVISQLKPLTADDKRNRTLLDEKMKEMEPLNAALGKLKKNAVTDKGVVLCSSEEELNNLIQRLHYQIQHESNTLVEEKQLLKHIKQLEGTREKVILNASMRAKIHDSVGQPEEIREQLKLLSDNLYGARKEKGALRVKIKVLEEELKAIDLEIIPLEEELASVYKKQERAYETLNELRKARDDMNACYYLNRSLLNNARDLAGKKDVAALEELCHVEVDKFMSQWCSNKAFRDDYEQRILSSLDSRQLSRDGRMRNPGEKPIILEAATPAELQPAVVKETTKRSTDVKIKTLVQSDAVSTKKAQKEEVETKTSGADVEDTVVVSEKSQQESLEATVIDAAKLKELIREEEIAKAKLALERKKKLAEKAAAKAAVRAQKEAEKKLKEREKRAAKRKADTAGAASPFDQSEVETKSEESEEDGKHKEVAAPLLTESKDQMENVRYRKRSNGYSDQLLPKIIYKRKKSYTYWVWFATAIVFVMMLVMLGYYYYSFKRK